ncbi:hypothetical protein [Candidatus Sororendozoicomonas aggregata]|uniref:hypothetical protein n=1 Tax=Candidatus Sororendozoicomonas aggregata TaxID=3073239 RepID=UPI002ED30B8D
MTSTSTSTVATSTISQNAEAPSSLPEQQPGAAYTGMLSVNYDKLLKDELTDFSAWQQDQDLTFV